MKAGEPVPSGKWRRATILLTASVAVVLAVWDVIVVFLNDEQGDSISRIMQWFGYNWAVPFFFGCVFIGHFFWPGKPILPQPWAVLVMAIPWLAVLVLGFVVDLPRIHSMIPVVLGIIAGRLFWPLPPI